VIAVYLMLTARAVVFVVFLIAALVAATHWAVKHGHISPFSPLPRGMRKLGQPFLRPFEKSLHRSGGNPVNAPYAFFWVALLGGLALLALVEWLIRTVFALAASAAAGPRGILLFVVDSIFSILIVAVFIRVAASWFGISPYSRPMRVVYGLTSWLIDPLRKVIPPVGMFDITPMIALILLWLARGLVMGVL